MNSFMDKEYHMNNAGMPPPQHLKLDTTMSIPWNGMNLINTELSSNSSSSAYIDQYYARLESTLSSITSSPVPTTLPLSNDVFALREMIGKQLGGGMSNASHSSYNSAPVSSTSPKLHLPNMGSLGNSLLPPVPPIACDPGFAERAAKFSCFGSRSFNGRTMVNNADLAQRYNHLATGNAKLQRVSSSPALKQSGSPLETKNMSQLQMESVTYNGNLMTSDKKSSSNEESSVSELFLNGETESKSDMNLKKRKANSRVKSYKSSEGEDEGALKRSMPTESGDKTEIKAANNDENDQKQKANQKPPEPPKDYIHVRARRGQATDSHSLAERVRREKISERMKLLQDLVPGCNKVTGKALMLDEIINYVQSLQRQVEFLSMKLATVNPGVDFNMNNILPKDVFQENGTLQQHLYPIDDTSSPAFYHHHHHHHHHHQNVQHQQQPLHNNANVSVDPLGIQFPSLTGFSEFPAFGEDDLQSIVHMGFAQNPVDFPAAPDEHETTDVKIEL